VRFKTENLIYPSHVAIETRRAVLLASSFSISLKLRSVQWAPFLFVVKIFV